MNPRTLLPSSEARVFEPATATQIPAAGIVSRTLLQTPELRAVLFDFAEGQELTGHSSKRRALVEILEGACEFQFNGGWAHLKAGALLHLPPGHPHAVRAHAGPFSMLLILGAEAPVA